MPEHQIIIDTAGRVAFVYDDELQPLLAEGRSKITRASHVEPDSDCEWAVDLRPLERSFFFGYETRQAALDQERQSVNGIIRNGALPESFFVTPSAGIAGQPEAICSW